MALLFVANSTIVAGQANPVSPVYMASTSQTASSNWQAMTAQPKLQKCSPNMLGIITASFHRILRCCALASSEVL